MYSQQIIVAIENGFIRMEYTDKIEIHMRNYGNITLLENQLIPSSRNKQKITKSEVIERLRVLDIKDMNVSRTLYPF